MTQEMKRLARGVATENDLWGHKQKVQLDVKLELVVSLESAAPLQSSGPFILRRTTAGGGFLIFMTINKLLIISHSHLLSTLF